MAIIYPSIATGDFASKTQDNSFSGSQTISGSLIVSGSSFLLTASTRSQIAVIDERLDLIVTGSRVGGTQILLDATNDSGIAQIIGQATNDVVMQAGSASANYPYYFHADAGAKFTAIEADDATGAIYVGGTGYASSINIGTAGSRNILIGNTSGSTAIDIKAGTAGTTISGALTVTSSNQRFVLKQNDLTYISNFEDWAGPQSGDPNYDLISVRSKDWLWIGTGHPTGTAGELWIDAGSKYAGLNSTTWMGNPNGWTIGIGDYDYTGSVLIAVSGSKNTIIGNINTGSSTTISGNLNITGSDILFKTTNIILSSSNLASSNDIIVNSLSVGVGSGLRSTRLGFETLTGSTGADNIAIGHSAGKVVTTGNGNTFIGRQAGRIITTATNNVYIGNYTGGFNVTGTSNTAVGESADAVCVGRYNTSLGNAARINSNFGQLNTAVGYSALTADFNNCTSLGAQASVNGNNQVQLGDSATTTYAYGAVQDRSDARDKAEVENTSLGLNFINKLRPVDFKWDYREDYKINSLEQKEIINENGDINLITENKTIELPKDGSKKRVRKHHGLIAQEVKQSMDELGVDFGGYQDHSMKGGNDILSIGYQELIAPMIKSIQQLKAENDDLKQRLELIENTLLSSSNNQSGSQS